VTVWFDIVDNETFSTADLMRSISQRLTADAKANTIIASEAAIRSLSEVKEFIEEEDPAKLKVVEVAEGKGDSYKPNYGISDLFEYVIVPSETSYDPSIFGDDESDEYYSENNAAEICKELPELC